MGSSFFPPTGRNLPLVTAQLNLSPSHWLPDQSNIHSQENSQAGKRLVAIATYTTVWSHTTILLLGQEHINYINQPKPLILQQQHLL